MRLVTPSKVPRRDDLGREPDRHGIFEDTALKLDERLQQEASERAIAIVRSLPSPASPDERARILHAMARALAIATRVYGADDGSVVEQLREEFGSIVVEHSFDGVFGAQQMGSA